MHQGASSYSPSFYAFLMCRSARSWLQDYFQWGVPCSGLFLSRFFLSVFSSFVLFFLSVFVVLSASLFEFCWCGQSAVISDIAFLCLPRLLLGVSVLPLVFCSRLSLPYCLSLFSVLLFVLGSSESFADISHQCSRSFSGILVWSILPLPFLLFSSLLVVPFLGPDNGPEIATQKVSNDCAWGRCLAKFEVLQYFVFAFVPSCIYF